MLFNMIMEFLFEILGINVTKLFIAFKSELALLALQTTASKVLGGITLALASFDYILLWRRTYIAYHKGTGCCTCCTLGIEYKNWHCGYDFLPVYRPRHSNILLSKIYYCG